MFTNICSACSKVSFCSKIKVFVVSNKLRVQSDVKFQLEGLFELYDRSLVKKGFDLLMRFRRFLGFRYIFKTNDVNMYLKKSDVEKRVDDFVLNEDTKFFEYKKPKIML